MLRECATHFMLQHIVPVWLIFRNVIRDYLIQSECKWAKAQIHCHHEYVVYTKIYGRYEARLTDCCGYSVISIEYIIYECVCVCVIDRCQ